MKMKKEEELLRDLKDMAKETKSGKLAWKIIQQTTEYNDMEMKPVVNEDGKNWIVDECYVSFNCEYKGNEFLMITYEMIHTSGDDVRTTNLVFLPPLGIRFFDLNTLLPYAVENSNMLSYEIHTLWEVLLSLRKENAEQIFIDIQSRVLTIEDN